MLVLQALQGDDGFLSPQRLKNYNSMRNDPCSPKAVSTLSAYLHFGQISAQRVAFEASKHRSKYKVKQTCLPAAVWYTHHIAASHGLPCKSINTLCGV